MFSSEFCEISKNTFSYRTPLVAASMHSMTKVELDLISGVDMCVFEKGMGGDISNVSKKYSRTDNKHLSSYGPKKKQNISNI